MQPKAWMNGWKEKNRCVKLASNELWSQSDWNLWKEVKSAISKGNPTNMQELEQISIEKCKKRCYSFYLLCVELEKDRTTSQRPIVLYIRVNLSLCGQTFVAPVACRPLLCQSKTLINLALLAPLKKICKMYCVK